jgi:DNA invertase Pin-like site-specific DNA recombinase
MAVGYIRVSTDEQEISGLGLDAQRIAIGSEVIRRGWTLVGI